MSADDTSEPNQGELHDLPLARAAEPMRRSRLWIVPIGAALLAIVLGWQSWGARGTRIKIQFDQGHGLEQGATLQHLGVSVGLVLSCELDPQGTGVLVTVRLDEAAAHLARSGSRFWIERPRLDLEGLAGLQTLFAGPHLAVQPGAGATARRFTGLPEAPLPEARQPGLDILLDAERRGSLSVGSPVTYRRVTIGRVLSVGLASDGRGVRASARILRPYVELIRESTRFWDTSGAQLEVGLSGVKWELDTLQSLVRGGVALATPPDAGPVVGTGYRFVLHPRAKDAWLGWQPNVALGDLALPEGTPRPQPVRARLTWTSGLLWSGEHSREGWALPLGGGLVLPGDLLTPPEKHDAGSARLEVLGVARALPDDTSATLGATHTDDVAHIKLDDAPGLLSWPRARQRVPTAPEDCLVISEPGRAPLVLDASRFAADGEGWWLDAELLPDPRQHGAPVLARSDGALIGLLLVGEDSARLAPLRRPMP